MLYPESFDSKAWMFCYYKNQTQTPQVLQISNIENWYFEKLVLPQEGVVFEAPEMAQLQIHYQSPLDRIEPEVIPCAHIRVKYGKDFRGESELKDLGRPELKVISINRTA